MNTTDCLKLSPDFKVSTKTTPEGEYQVGAEWTNALGVPCAAFVRMKLARTPKEEAFFIEQLCIACHRMMTEDAAAVS